MVEESHKINSDYPLVTVAVPLYKSLPFVARIIANIRAISYPNVEILISDRHGYDNAIDIISQALAEDPRVAIMKNYDGIGFSEHYNVLLGDSRGKYCRILPHDDEIPVCQLHELVDLLEKNTKAVLAYGPETRVYFDGRPNHKLVPQRGNVPGWSYETSLFLFHSGYHYCSFKGLFRMSVIRDNQICLHTSKYLNRPDRCFVFAISLIGPFEYFPDQVFIKHMHADSTSLNWRQNTRSVDILSTSWHLWLYQWQLDRAPLRLVAFWTFIPLLTIRRILLNTPIKRKYKRLIKSFPGTGNKNWIKTQISRI